MTPGLEHEHSSRAVSGGSHSRPMAQTAPQTAGDPGQGATDSNRSAGHAPTARQRQRVSPQGGGHQAAQAGPSIAGQLACSGGSGCQATSWAG